ncbi:hypothetical protein JNUCC42_13280 [Brevibacterium sp. JNUCC-42]|nr:hypothetical protein JNUCC42_13280 [Brevibacterium sp. JNUCC-42]
MASLTVDRKMFIPGIHYTAKPTDSGITLNIEIKWYGFLLTAWNIAHHQKVKWYQYPKLCGLVLWHTFLFLKKERKKKGGGGAKSPKNNQT